DDRSAVVLQHGRELGRGRTNTAVDQYNQRSMPDAFFVGILRRCEEEVRPRLAAQCVWIGGGEQAGTEKPFAEPFAIRMPAAPERRGIAGRCRLFASAFHLLGKRNKQSAISAPRLSGVGA